jgi:hypothetical protein
LQGQQLGGRDEDGVGGGSGHGAHGKPFGAVVGGMPALFIATGVPERMDVGKIEWN